MKKSFFGFQDMPIPQEWFGRKDGFYYRDNSAPLCEVSWRNYYATRNIVTLYREHLDKWSLFWRIARRRLMAALSIKPQKLKVINAGIRDGKADKTGLHEVYRPGWK